MKTRRTALSLGFFLTASAPGLEAAPAEKPGVMVEYEAPPFRWRELNLAGFTKVLCSAVFISGREPEEAIEKSGSLFLDERARESITEMVVDRERREVRVTLDGSLTKRARYVGDQGCVILPEDTGDIHFRPEVVRSRLPDAMTLDWPMGDREPADPTPAHDAAKIAAAIDLAFARPEFETAAFLVLYRGRIIGERYGPSIDRETQLESWSMGKSLTALLVGVLAEQGALSLQDPAPIAEWQSPGDERARIRIADLLRMSSGLHFTSHHDPDYSPATSYPDHFYIYTGAIDAYDWCLRKPPQFPPSTQGRYRNCDPLILGSIMKRILAARGESYLTFPQRALFDRIGIRKMVLETDPYGNFLLTGYDYGTGRSWARLGLLCLRDGLWNGERILAEGWIDFVSTPAPAWDDPVYGGLFWINGTSIWNLPEDAYYMAGAGGQYVFIVPSHELVIVRMGHTSGDSTEMREFLRKAQGLILEAVRQE